MKILGESDFTPELHYNFMPTIFIKGEGHLETSSDVQEHSLLSYVRELLKGVLQE